MDAGSIVVFTWLGVIPFAALVGYRSLGQWDEETGNFEFCETDLPDLAMGSIFWPIVLFAFLIFCIVEAGSFITKKTGAIRLVTGKRPEHIEKALKERKIREIEKELELKEYPL